MTQTQTQTQINHHSFLSLFNSTPFYHPTRNRQRASISSTAFFMFRQLSMFHPACLLFIWFLRIFALFFSENNFMAYLASVLFVIHFFIFTFHPSKHEKVYFISQCSYILLLFTPSNQTSIFIPSQPMAIIFSFFPILPLIIQEYSYSKIFMFVSSFCFSLYLLPEKILFESSLLYSIEILWTSILVHTKYATIDKYYHSAQQSFNKIHFLIRNLFPSALHAKLLPETTQTLTWTNLSSTLLHPKIIPPTFSSNLQRLEDVSVIFVLIKGFEQFCNDNSPTDVFILMNELYHGFDLVMHHYGLTTINLISGSIYIGYIDRIKHNDFACACALDLRDSFRNFFHFHQINGLACCIGVNSGPISTGVVNNLRFHVDIFGDTVNVASRLMNGASPGSVLVSERVAKSFNSKFFKCGPSVLKKFKGKRPMKTFLIDWASTVYKNPNNYRRRSISFSTFQHQGFQVEESKHISRFTGDIFKPSSPNQHTPEGLMRRGSIGPGFPTVSTIGAKSSQNLAMTSSSSTIFPNNDLDHVQDLIHSSSFSHKVHSSLDSQQDPIHIFPFSKPLSDRRRRRRSSLVVSQTLNSFSDTFLRQKEFTPKTTVPKYPNQGRRASFSFLPTKIMENQMKSSFPNPDSSNTVLISTLGGESYADISSPAVMSSVPISVIQNSPSSLPTSPTIREFASSPVLVSSPSIARESLNITSPMLRVMQSSPEIALLDPMNRSRRNSRRFSVPSMVPVSANISRLPIIHEQPCPKINIESETPWCFVTLEAHQILKSDMFGSKLFPDDFDPPDHSFDSGDSENWTADDINLISPNASILNASPNSHVGSFPKTLAQKISGLGHTRSTNGLNISPSSPLSNGSNGSIGSPSSIGSNDSNNSPVSNILTSSKRSKSSAKILSTPSSSAKSSPLSYVPKTPPLLSKLKENLLPVKPTKIVVDSGLFNSESSRQFTPDLYNWYIHRGLFSLFAIILPILFLESTAQIATFLFLGTILQGSLFLSSEMKVNLVQTLSFLFLLLPVGLSSSIGLRNISFFFLPLLLLNSKLFLNFGVNCGIILLGIFFQQPFLSRDTVSRSNLMRLVSLFLFIYAFQLYTLYTLSFSVASKYYRESQNLICSLFPVSQQNRFQSLSHKQLSLLSRLPTLDYSAFTIIITSDLTNYTQWSDQHADRPEYVVQFLEKLYQSYDQLCADCGLEKMQTIGDAYMAFTGNFSRNNKKPLPTKKRQMVISALSFAFLAHSILDSLTENFDTDVIPMCHTSVTFGPIFGGIMSSHRVLYNYWGPAATRASALESVTPSGNIAIPFQLLKDCGLILHEPEIHSQAYSIKLPKTLASKIGQKIATSIKTVSLKHGIHTDVSYLLFPHISTLVSRQKQK